MHGARCTPRPCECWYTRQKSTSVYLGAMPADGFDAAAKKSGPRHVPLAAPKRAMGGTYISGKDVGRGMALTMSRYTATIRGQADVSQTSSSRRDRPTADFRAAGGDASQHEARDVAAPSCH